AFEKTASKAPAKASWLARSCASPRTKVKAGWRERAVRSISSERSSPVTAAPRAAADVEHAVARPHGQQLDELVTGRRDERRALVVEARVPDVGRLGHDGRAIA